MGTKIMTGPGFDNMTARPETIGVFSTGIAKLPHLTALVGVKDAIMFPSHAEADRIDVVVGWGLKPTARKARAYARRHGLDYLALEDGFLRSAGSARHKPLPLSLVLDDAGIYTDASRPSRVERLIREAPAFPPDLRWQASEGLEAVLFHRLTKYNTVSSGAAGERLAKTIRVLLVDQVYGDQSISGGLASEASFARMLETALQTFPAGAIAVKVHPDVLAGRARGYIDEPARRHGLTRIVGMGNPHDLLEGIEAVWTVSSQLGLEAVFKGCKVRCFGVPFYAGWGLTEDTPDNASASSALARRGAPRSPVDVFAAAFAAYANYADPVTRQPISLMRAIERLVAWRDYAQECSGKTWYIGFPRRMRVAERFFADGGGRIEHVSLARSLDAARGEVASVLMWQKRGSARAVGRLQAHGERISLVHEGPLSLGGGTPCSIVRETALDTVKGVDNATIVNVLAHHHFEPALLKRAAALRAALVSAAEVAPASALPSLTAKADGRRVVLIAGEPARLERAFGVPRVVRDVDGLVRTVREKQPDAFLVEAVPANGLRDRMKRSTGAMPPGVDMVVRESDLPALYRAIDEVHVLRSHVGLEALIHAKHVECWGAPFFAGWGLTSDHVPIPGRLRQLSIDELIAAALILVPRYVDPETGVYCEVEALVARYLDRLRNGAGERAGESGGGDRDADRPNRAGRSAARSILDDLARRVRSLG